MRESEIAIDHSGRGPSLLAATRSTSSAASNLRSQRSASSLLAIPPDFPAFEAIRCQSIGRSWRRQACVERMEVFERVFSKTTAEAPNRLPS